MDVGLHNGKMTALLITHLIAQGVTRFCLSPGSRSTALALAAAQNPEAHCDTHFDERGLGFYALGIAKGSGKPVAIIVTSGTAVGNLLPAIMEASNDHIPLIVITADRPHELRDCSANQSSDQVKLFTSFIRWQADLPFSDPKLPAHYLASAIGQAVFLSQCPRPGPVHLNCMLREPFFSAFPFEIEEVQPRLCQVGTLIPSCDTIKSWALTLSHIKKGLIVVGALPHDAKIDPLFALAETLGWPICADILSQARSHTHSHLISYFDSLINADYHQPPGAVIHLGTRTVSKSVSEWLTHQNLTFYLHITDYPSLLDPHHIVTHRLYAPGLLCAKMLSEAVPSDPDPQWMNFWKEGNEIVSSKLEHLFSESLDITEAGLIYNLGKLGKKGMGLFLANSMPIRDADKFFPSLNLSVPLFGNRGVSGIDGNIATAVGIAQGMQKPLIALLGDLAFLHDMNSLSLLSTAKYPVCLIVVNNSGGGIFSFLPVYEKKEPFERFFASAHSYSFSHAAQMFNLPYVNPNTLEQIDILLSDFSQNKHSILIEIVTDRTENLHAHQHVAAAIKTELSLGKIIGARCR